MRVLVLAASGLLGNAVFRVLSASAQIETIGTIRRAELRRFFIPELSDHLTIAADLGDPPELARLLDRIRPQVVINCAGLKKSVSPEPMRSIAMFSLLPQRLSYLCRSRMIRLVQVSSDCVFSGKKGNYSEDDLPDAQDLYGLSKLLGEVNERHAITIRTSIIGPELQNGNGLLSWFLAQHRQCPGFTRAIFSGLPTVVLAQVIYDKILPRQDLSGIYHIAARPISKFDLLKQVAERYSKAIKLLPDDRLIIDRSLCPRRFQEATGYVSPAWPTLIDRMYSDNFGLTKK